MPRILAVLLLLLACMPLAQARSRDLGPVPVDDPAAQATLPDRQQRVIRELACGVESTCIRQKLMLSGHPHEIMKKGSGPGGRSAGSLAAGSGATASPQEHQTASMNPRQ